MPEGIEPLWKARLGQAVAFSRDSKLLAVGGAHGPARLLDAQTGKLVAICEGPKRDIHEIAFSHDGRLVAIGEFNRRLAICEATTGQLVGDLRLGDSEINSLTFSSKTGHLIRSSRNVEIEVFDPNPLATCTPIKTDPDAHSVLKTSFFPDGGKLFATWSTKSGKQEVTAAIFSNTKRMASATLDFELVYDVSISSDGCLVALVFSSHNPPRAGIALLNGKTLKLIHTILTDRIGCVAFIPSKALIIASDVEDDVECFRLLDSKSKRELGQFNVGNSVFGFDISRDGRYLAAATSGGAMVWDLEVVLSTSGLE
jgi:dipeptidyl aminopeptidase/acylaminoacyl peptidase